MLVTGWLLGFIILLAFLLLFLLYTSGAFRRKERSRVSVAGSQPNSSSMAMASGSESVSVEGAETQTSDTGEEEGKQPSPGPEVAGGDEGWTTVGGGRFSHPVYKKLSSLNGELNGLPLSKIKEKLTALNLSSMYVSTYTAVIYISIHKLTSMIVLLHLN